MLVSLGFRHAVFGVALQKIVPERVGGFKAKPARDPGANPESTCRLISKYSVTVIPGWLMGVTVISNRLSRRQVG